MSDRGLMTPRRGWIGLAIAALALAGGVGWAAGWLGASDRPRVEVVENGRIVPGLRLPFRYQPFDEPRLDTLATREHLPDVVAAGRTQFEQITRLKDWVAAQWPHSDPDPYPPWDALLVLDWIRAGTTGGFCGQYSQVFLQSLAALGFTARYVEIGTTDNPYAHYVTEVWSNEFDRWVMMDVDYNFHFQRDGIPLSALEIHDALLADDLADVDVVLGAVREGHPTPADWPQRTAELYYYLRYHLKADHLTKPGEPPFDRLHDMVEWQDDRVVPWETSTVDSPFPKERLTSRRTSDRGAVTASLNQVRVRARLDAPRHVVVALTNNVFQWQTYQYRELPDVGEPGSWTAHAGPELIWTVSPAAHRMEVRGVNVRGVAGPSSVIRLAGALE